MSEIAVVLYSIILFFEGGGGSADAARSNKQGWGAAVFLSGLDDDNNTHTPGSREQRQRRCSGDEEQAKLDSRPPGRGNWMNWMSATDKRCRGKLQSRIELDESRSDSRISPT